MGIGFNKYVFTRYLFRMGSGILHTTQNVSSGSIICPWSWVFVGSMQYAPTCTIQSLPEIGFNKYVFIGNLSRIGRGVLHTSQHIPSLRFIVQRGIKFLSRIGRVVLHTPLNVSGGSIICPWSWAFVRRMQYAPTRTIQSLSGIRFNKYVFMRYLSRIGRGVLHTPWHVSDRSIICPWSWAFVGRMQYAPTPVHKKFIVICRRF